MQAGLAAFKALLAASMPPAQAAEIVFEAIQKEQFYIVTHPEWTGVIESRTEHLLRMENPQSPTPSVTKAVSRSE